MISEVRGLKKIPRRGCLLIILQFALEDHLNFMVLLEGKVDDFFDMQYSEVCHLSQWSAYVYIILTSPPPPPRMSKELGQTLPIVNIIYNS